MAQAWMARGSLRWMTAEDYIRVFREDFTVDLTDPEILLITGSVYRDGRIDVGPSYRLSSGLADEPNAPGDLMRASTESPKSRGCPILLRLCPLELSFLS